MIPAYTASTTAGILWNDIASTTANIVNNSHEFIFIFLGTLLAFCLVFGIMKALVGAVNKIT